MEHWGLITYRHHGTFGAYYIQVSWNNGTYNIQVAWITRTFYIQVLWNIGDLLYTGIMKHWELITYRYHGTLRTYYIQVSWNTGNLLHTGIMEH